MSLGRGSPPQPEAMDSADICDSALAEAPGSMEVAPSTGCHPIVSPDTADSGERKKGTT